MRRLVRTAASIAFWLLLAGCVLLITIGPVVGVIIIGVGVGLLLDRVLPGQRDRGAP